MRPNIGDTYIDIDDDRYQWTVEAVTDVEQGFYLVEIAPPNDPTVMSVVLTPDEWAEFVLAHRFTGSSPSLTGASG